MNNAAENALRKIISAELTAEHPNVRSQCLNTLKKIISNIVQHPDQEKFRKIPARSKTLQNDILKAKGGQAFLLELGFTVKVMEFEEFYVINNDESTLAKLKLADTLLDEVIITAEEKRIRTEREEQLKKHEEKIRREQVQLLIEEDKATRQMKAELAKK
jgi:hypothetical protein